MVGESKEQKQTRSPGPTNAVTDLEAPNAFGREEEESGKEMNNNKRRERKRKGKERQCRRNC